MIWAVLICSMGCLSPQSGGPFAIAKLVNITQRTMVYGTQKNYTYCMGFIEQFGGGAHCRLANYDDNGMFYVMCFFRPVDS